jgi:hypothetical protein
MPGLTRMKKPFVILTFMSLGLAVSAAAAPGAPASNESTSPAAELVEVVWDSPSVDSRGSLPIGNGDMGANVWVEPSGDLLLLLSKSDAWDEVSRLCKLGLLRIRLPSVTGFRQELRLADGEIRIAAGGVTTRVWIDASHPVLHVEMEGVQTFTTSVAHETWRTQEKTLTGGEIRACWGQQGSPDPLIISADTVLDGQMNQVVFFHRNPTSVWEKNLRNQGLDALVKPEDDPLLHRTFGALVRGENLIQNGKNKLTAAKPATSFSIKVHALTARASTAEDWVKQVTAQAEAVERTPLAAARAAHAKWWQEFWNRSWISAAENTTKAIPENKHPWRVGVAADGSSKFGGTITDALVVGRAASADEIATLAGKPRAGADTTPKEVHLTDGCTVAAWIRPATGESGRVLDKCTPFGHDGMIFDTYPGLALRLIVGEHMMTHPGCLKAGEWQHVAATVDAGARRIYLNGKLVLEEGGKSAAETVTNGYTLQRWVNACAGRGAYPIKFNGSLFNVETLRNPVQSYCGHCQFDADFREWGNPYWAQNTRLPYWTMPAAGDFDLMKPLFKMYMDALPLRKQLTRLAFNHDGAFYPETMEFWGGAPDSDFGRPGDESRKGLPPGQTRHGYMQYYPQGALEMLNVMNCYFEFTGDTAFRDSTLLPFGKEILDYYRLHWPRTAEGKLNFTGLTSLEQAADTTNPAPDIAGLRAILPKLAACTPDSGLRVQWTKMLADLPPLPMKESNGQQILAMAEKTPARVSGFEKPELYAVFPYRLFGVGRPELDLALETWKQRGNKKTGGWQQDAIQAALLGLSDEAKSYVTENYSRTAPGFRFPAMWGPNYDWIPDQDHGCVPMAAMQSMLLQPVGEKLLLFPAWPKEWDVNFKLHAPQNTTIECEAKNGIVVKLIVTPESRRQNVEICRPFVENAVNYK